MSHTSNCTIPVDWIIVTSKLGSENCVNFKLGNALNDLWTFELFKKLSSKGIHIIFSITRKKCEQRVMADIELKFTDLHSNNSSNMKYVKRFNHVNNTKASYHLSKYIRQIFIIYERIRVTGKASFHLLTTSWPAASPQAMTTLSSDFKKLCNSAVFSDVILRCGSEVFTAHKNILATRCPVFNDMLVNNARDDSKIEIKDIEPHVFKAVLLFIYSGDTAPLTFQSACELLDAADKYCLFELKTICISYITSSFNIGNVLDYFQNYEIAKTYALEFISEYLSEIKQTKQWLNFRSQFPDLVSKLGDISEAKQSNPKTAETKEYYSRTSELWKDNTDDSADLMNNKKILKKDSQGIKREFSSTSRILTENLKHGSDM